MTRKKFIMSAEEWCTLPELDVPAIYSQFAKIIRQRAHKTNKTYF